MCLEHNSDFFVHAAQFIYDLCQSSGMELPIIIEIKTTLWLFFFLLIVATKYKHIEMSDILSGEEKWIIVTYGANKQFHQASSTGKGLSQFPLWLQSNLEIPRMLSKRYLKRCEIQLGISRYSQFPGSISHRIDLIEF